MYEAIERKRNVPQSLKNYILMTHTQSGIKAVSDSEITHDLFHCFYVRRAAMGLLMSVVYGDGRD